jgi:hypothetical protein
MKRIFLPLILVTGFAIASCGESEEEKKKEPTAEEMTNEVCDCFKKNQDEPMDCFRMQGEYYHKIPMDDRQKFMDTTNECSSGEE